MEPARITFFDRLKAVLIGKARKISEPNLFHNLSLIAFFAWVGLGADGLSSSCYGPEEAFLALKGHVFLGLIVAAATAATVFIISASYSQIIELFPTGGGGYLVASKLLSPSAGMVSGCALLVDYILTITLSIASGADAIFSFLPHWALPFKLIFAISGVLALMVLNLRGVKESVLPLIPVFIIFLVTHVFAIIYTLCTHLSDFSSVAITTVSDIQRTSSELGILGMFILIMRAYSMGAGTYTGIEAVSNGIPILREPRVQTAKKTMRYMSASLAFMAAGLMVGYILYNVSHQPGKTLNASLFASMTSSWDHNTAMIFVLITLVSEGVLLFVAAQTGFLDGPRVLANMAQDRWLPFQFTLLSERFVIKHGILLMGGSALVLMVLSRGSVKFLIVLYAINVFITFFLSQLGMVRHWWQDRGIAKDWKKKITVNGIGLILTSFILSSVVVIKFHEGGWITIFITGSLAGFCVFVRRYYYRTRKLLARLDHLVTTADISKLQPVMEHEKTPVPEMDVEGKTAVILVSGFNGMGLHTLFNVIRLFGGMFKNFFFIEAGIIDTGTFKGAAEIEKLKSHVQSNLNKYVDYMKSQGFYAQGFSTIGTDVSDEISNLSGKLYDLYPNTIFFGGQIVFPEDTIMTKMLYNYTTFTVQRRLHQAGIPFLVMPIKVT